MDMYDIILKKRNGSALEEAEIRQLVADYTAGRIPDYQMSALCMAIYYQGMSDQETAWLTDAMARSGEMIDLTAVSPHTVDKHSTGGVGDKTTLVVGPLVASLGGTIAKMTARGLGHTGGTIDKLESIPGFRVALEPEEMLSQARSVGLVVAGQTAELAPADKRLYALRDVTATVDSIPLIVSSIMSKKLAAGAGSIVLDVKVGSGAFSKTLDFASELARQMIAIGTACGRNMAAVITNMDRPLGHAVGNALEVQEAIALLRGEDIPDLKDVCLTLAANMLSLCRGWSLMAARQQAEAALADGRALAKFREWIIAQGGDPAVIDQPGLLPAARYHHEVRSQQAGFITAMDTQAIGRISTLLGAGRQVMEDVIDPGAGLTILAKTGDLVTPGQVLAILHTGDVTALPEAERQYRAAVAVGPEQPPLTPTVFRILRGEASKQED